MDETRTVLVKASAESINALASDPELVERLTDVLYDECDMGGASVAHTEHLLRRLAELLD